MMGFTFNNKHSSEYGIYIRSIDRSLRPEKRKNLFLINGKHGYLDYGNETYENRYISVELNFIKNSLEDLRTQVRSVAEWLSKQGNLIFDDEPNKAYPAKIYDAISLEQINTTGVTSVIFECQPFAESLQFNQVNIPEVTTKPYEIPVNVSGTSETCCIITIKNTGTTNINNITITRKAAI